jgi:hypothetical protein
VIDVSVTDFTADIFIMSSHTFHTSYKVLLQAAYQYVTKYVVTPHLSKYYLKERCDSLKALFQFHNPAVNGR